MPRAENPDFNDLRLHYMFSICWISQLPMWAHGSNSQRSRSPLRWIMVPLKWSSGSAKSRLLLKIQSTTFSPFNDLPRRTNILSLSRSPTECSQCSTAPRSTFADFIGFVLSWEGKDGNVTVEMLEGVTISSQLSGFFVRETMQVNILHTLGTPGLFVLTGSISIILFFLQESCLPYQIQNREGNSLKHQQVLLWNSASYNWTLFWTLQIFPSCSPKKRIILHSLPKKAVCCHSLWTQVINN